MKQLILKIMVLISIAGLFGCSGSNDPAKWSSKKTDTWFEKGEWLNHWSEKPDPSIDRTEFALAYFRNRERWDRAFAFLRDNDLTKLEVRRHDLDGDNLYVSVSEYTTKNEEDAKFEVHRKYIDIQYVVNGSEFIGIAPLTSQDSILQKYDDTKDIEFLSIKGGQKVKATPDKFFIFFPGDAHMPGLKDGINSPVRKIVVKVRID